MFDYCGIDIQPVKFGTANAPQFDIDPYIAMTCSARSMHLWPNAAVFSHISGSFALKAHLIPLPGIGLATGKQAMV